MFVDSVFRCLERRICVGRVDGQMGEVEEQGLLGLVIPDDLLRLLGEQVRGVVSVVTPCYRHVPPEIIAPTILIIESLEYQYLIFMSVKYSNFEIIIIATGFPLSLE